MLRQNPILFGLLFLMIWVPTHATAMALANYEEWKRAWEKKVADGNLDFFAQVSSLGSCAGHKPAYTQADLDDLAGKDDFGTILGRNAVKADLETTAEKPYCYRFLEEKMGRHPSADQAEINEAWVQEIVKHNRLFRDMQINDKEFRTTIPATDLQASLMQEAKQLLQFEHDILVFSGKDNDNAFTTHRPGSVAIALCQTLDIDEMVGTLYHELGHAVHLDTEPQTQRERRKDPQKFLEQPDVKRDIGLVKDMLKIGSTAFNDRTEVGRRMLAQLKLSPWTPGNPYWNAPTEKNERIKAEADRAMEQRADLFAMAQLYKQGKMGAILKGIHKYADSSNTVAAERDEHPSHFERGLYFAGFLVSKGHDVNKLFYEYENQGICINPHKLDLAGNPFKTHGANQAPVEYLRAYEQWLKDHPFAFYDAWRKSVQREWLGNKTLAEKRNALVVLLNRALKQATENPSNYLQKREALFCNNLLAELYEHPPAASYEQIDITWLDEIDYRDWKDSMLQMFEKNAFRSEQINQVFSQSVIDFLKKRETMAKDSREAREGFFTYNLLRELNKESRAASIHEVDEEWLKKLAPKKSFWNWFGY